MSRTSDILGIYEIDERWNSTKLKDGFVLTQNESPELDSMTVIIENEAELDIRQYDVVGLNDHIHDEDVYFIVATLDEEKATDVNNVHTYKYTLNLVSPTKLFELVVLPNISNTNVGQNRTIADVVKEKIDYYMNEKNFDGLSQQNPIFAFDWPYGLGDMICPEFTLGSSTMREFLNYLWSIKNCTFQCKIQIIEDAHVFVLSYLDYNKRGSQIHTEDMVITRSNSIENNATCLKSDVGNVINPIDNLETQSFKSDSYLYQTSDLKVILNYPIYDINSFRIHFKVKKYYGKMASGGIVSEFGHVIFEVGGDATNYIYEKKIYNTLNVMQPEGSAGSTSGWTYPNKNTACYWERGNNIIDGLLYPTEGWLGWSTEYALNFIIKHLVITNDDVRLISGQGTTNWNTATWTTAPEGYNWMDENGSYTTTSPNLFYIESTIPDGYFFKINYKSYDNQTSVIVEQTMPINQRKAMITNNQNDAMIDINKFVVQNIEKINQMGNDQKQFVGMTTNIARLPKIGDYDGDYTVTNVRYQITNGVYEYIGNLSKYFVNTALYSFLDKQKRYTALVGADEALQRDETKRLYARINLGDSAYSGPINYSILSRVVMVQIGTTSVTSTDIRLLMPAKTRFCGNMITYSTCFKDNVVAASRKSDNPISGTSTYSNKDIKYVDSNGEFKGIKCKWFEDYTFNYYTDYDDIIRAVTYLPTAYTLETISGDDNGAYNYRFENRFNFRKDNRERISLTAEIIFKPESNNIIVGNNFSNFFVTSGIHVYKRTRAFTYLDQIINPNECTELTVSATASRDYIASIGYNNIRYEGVSGNIAFAGANNELLFAVNNYDGNYIRFSSPTDNNSIPEYVSLE